MVNKKVAVVSPSQIEQVNETFIRAHVDLIENTTFLYGGRIPFYSEGGGKVIRFSFLSKLKYKLAKALNLTSFSYNEYELYKYLKKNKFTTILAEYGDVGAELTPVAKKLGLDLLVHFHGADISMQHILEAYTEKYKVMFKYAKTIFSVSEPMSESIISLGCPREKVVLNVCSPNDHFFDVKVDYSNKTVVALGGFVDQKAPYFTVLAFHKVLQEVPDAKLYMGGTGPLLNACVFMAEYLGITKNVEFLGFVFPKDVPDLIAKGSIFVQHSVTALKGDMEGTPVGIMEAMAAGIPVVSTIHAGIPRVVKNDFNGYLVEEKDVDGMANRIVKLLNDEPLKKKLGENAKSFVDESYRMDTHIQRIVKEINA